jgi:putative polyhydroxyalkanoate system protein
MADIEITRVHNLGLKAARTQAERMADQLGRKFDLKGNWEGNVLRFERPGVTGSLAITEKDLRLAVSLGFLLKAMKGSIEKAVTSELDSLFAGDVVAKHRQNQTAEGPGTRREGKPSQPSALKSKKAPPSPKKSG